jgi:hypothetical protein
MIQLMERTFEQQISIPIDYDSLMHRIHDLQTMFNPSEFCFHMKSIIPQLLTYYKDKGNMTPLRFKGMTSLQRGAETVISHHLIHNHASHIQSKEDWLKLVKQLPVGPGYHNILCNPSHIAIQRDLAYLIESQPPQTNQQMGSYELWNDDHFLHHLLYPFPLLNAIPTVILVPRLLFSIRLPIMAYDDWRD